MAVCPPMSGDWMWVRDPDTGRLKRETDRPDVCERGHARPEMRTDWCPRCSQRTVVFYCRHPGCHWRAPGGRHLDYQCDPRLYDPNAGLSGLNRQERERYWAARNGATPKGG